VAAPLPWLEIFVDLPNLERALKAVGLPHKVDLYGLGTHTARHLTGGPYLLKAVYGFAATDECDPVAGTGTPEGHHKSYLTMKTVRLHLGHRLGYQDIREPLPEAGQAEIGREKGVDVNVAATIMQRALDGRYHAAVPVANDTDDVSLIRELRRVPHRVAPTLSSALGATAAPLKVYWACLPEQSATRYLGKVCISVHTAHPRRDQSRRAEGRPLV